MSIVNKLIIGFLSIIKEQGSSDPYTSPETPIKKIQESQYFDNL